MSYTITKQFPVTQEGGPPDEKTAIEFLREWTLPVKEAYEGIGDVTHKVSSNVMS